MKNPQPHETELVGEWIFTNGRMTGDEVCDRIEYLTEKVLKEIGRDTTGWDVLYQDPNDGQYWELTYPKSHMHGGGLPRLMCISAEQAKVKYSDVVHLV